MLWHPLLAGTLLSAHNIALSLAASRSTQFVNIKPVICGQVQEPEFYDNSEYIVNSYKVLTFESCTDVSEDTVASIFETYCI
jgi:hypothetical protein